MPIAGQITLDTVGNGLEYNVGVTPTMVEFLCGPLEGSGDDGVLYSNGVATSSYQGCLSITAKDGVSPTDKTVMKNDRIVWIRKKSSGSLVTVLRADFVEFDGTNIVLNVITANADYPVQLRVW